MEKDLFDGFTPSDAPPTKAPEKKTRKPRQVKQADNGNLAKTLQGLHAVIGIGLALPELAIGDDESKMQADAINAVMAEFDIPVSPATQALVNLAFVSFAIYAPRVHAIKERIKAEKVKDTEKEEE